MIFEERDKSFIKSINSNIIRAQQAEEPKSKINFLTKVVNDALFFGLVLKNRGDYKHSLEYIETSISANKEIKTILVDILEDIAFLEIEKIEK